MSKQNETNADRIKRALTPDSTDRAILPPSDSSVATAEDKGFDVVVRDRDTGREDVGIACVTDEDLEGWRAFDMSAGYLDTALYQVYNGRNPHDVLDVELVVRDNETGDVTGAVQFFDFTSLEAGEDLVDLFKMLRVALATARDKREAGGSDSEPLVLTGNMVEIEIGEDGDAVVGSAKIVEPEMDDEERAAEHLRDAARILRGEDN